MATKINTNVENRKKRFLFCWGQVISIIRRFNANYLTIELPYMCCHLLSFFTDGKTKISGVWFRYVYTRFHRSTSNPFLEPFIVHCSVIFSSFFQNRVCFVRNTMYMIVSCKDMSCSTSCNSFRLYAVAFLDRYTLWCSFYKEKVHV